MFFCSRTYRNIYVGFAVPKNIIFSVIMLSITKHDVDTNTRVIIQVYITMTNA